MRRALWKHGTDGWKIVIVCFRSLTRARKVKMMNFILVHFLPFVFSTMTVISREFNALNFKKWILGFWPFKIIYFIFNHVCMHRGRGESACECRHLQRLEESSRSLGAVVACGCELPVLDARHRSSVRAVHTLNCWDISLVPWSFIPLTF